MTETPAALYGVTARLRGGKALRRIVPVFIDERPGERSIDHYTWSISGAQQAAVCGPGATSHASIEVGLRHIQRLLENGFAHCRYLLRLRGPA